MCGMCPPQPTPTHQASHGHYRVWDWDGHFSICMHACIHTYARACIKCMTECWMIDECCFHCFHARMIVFNAHFSICMHVMETTFHVAQKQEVSQAHSSYGLMGGYISQNGARITKMGGGSKHGWGTRGHPWINLWWPYRTNYCIWGTSLIWLCVGWAPRYVTYLGVTYTSLTVICPIMYPPLICYNVPFWNYFGNALFLIMYPFEILFEGIPLCAPPISYNVPLFWAFSEVSCFS